MHMCCRNNVIRRIYLILKEIVPHMGIELKEGHDITFFGHKGKPPPYNSAPKPKAEPLPQPKEEVLTLILNLIVIIR